MTTIDLYARVSRASDTRMRSTDGQLLDCKVRAEDEGHAIGLTHVDNSISAWKPKVSRPAWEHLMHRLENGLTDGVIVFDLARFTRRPMEGERLIACAERGLIIMDSESQYDLRTPNGKKAFREQMSSAAYESDRLSTRTKRGKRLKAAQGEWNSSTRAFGFELGNVVPREEEAAVLREMAVRLLAGEKQAALCRELNERGVLTVLGNPWAPPSLRTALLRPANVGDVAHCGVLVKIGVHPGILDREIYDRLTAMFAARRRGRPITNLSTAFVICAVCKRGMQAKEMVRHSPYPDGRKMRTYSCDQRGGGCRPANRIDWADLDTFVRELALGILSDPRHADEIEAAAREADDELGKVNDRIAELESVATALSERLGRGDMVLARYDAAMRPMDEQLAQLYAQQAQLRAAAPAKAQATVVRSRAEWERRWAAADLADRREIVRRALRGQRLVVSAGQRLDPARDRVTLSV